LCSIEDLEVGDNVVGEPEEGGHVVGTLTELDDDEGTIDEAGADQLWRLPRQRIHRL
jgi:hypothetical protein